MPILIWKMWDNVRDYVEAEKYYLKVLENNDEHYGFSLYLMNDCDKPMEYVQKELRLHMDDKNINGLIFIMGC